MITIQSGSRHHRLLPRVVRLLAYTAFVRRLQPAFAISSGKMPSTSFEPPSRVPSREVSRS